MNSKFFSLLLAVFCLVGFVSAWDICIDTLAPEAPEEFIVSGNVLLSWDEAVDEPDCSGIEYYNIYLDNVLVGSSFSLSYSGSELADGTYVLGVSAVDEGGNEGNRAVREVVFPQGQDSGEDGGSDSSGSSGGSSGGGGGSSGGSSSSSNSSLNSTNSSSPVSLSSSSDDYDDSGMTWIDESEDDWGFFSTITGAVTGAVGSPGGMAVSVFVLLALSGFVIVRIRKKKD